MCLGVVAAGQQRPRVLGGIDPVVGVVPGGGGDGWVGFGRVAVWGGWVVWVVLRLVWKVWVSSVSRCRVPMLW